ncbi:hypothetical protein OKA05_06360 [Luteolibacter arcticus]|uniref:Uncharacterized protein n=1 Tax=Luteolibacter arcticus TaxID=1581411 RepID=A0ABT3GEX6_9BACT|nr:hypothetical protein [Luteolibacter arcticus]MCW1922167.1 hypothetical protein [Luteolibacter arcticus]
MNGECNPYAPPSNETAVAITDPGHGWRIENGSLLVCNGAVLPEICILGGDPSHPVERTPLLLHLSSGFRMLDDIRIEVFESRREHIRRSAGVLGSIVLGFAGGVISSILMIDDGSATPLSVSVSCFVIVLGIVGASWQSRYLPRITHLHGGWYRIGGISPGLLARLKDFGSDDGESAA